MEKISEHPRQRCKNSIKKLRELIASLNQKISCTDDYDSRENLKYFSNLYKEFCKEVNNVVIYLVSNRLTGFKKSIDESVFTIQDIIHCLKVLDERFTTLNNQSSEQLAKKTTKSNKDLVISIKYSLKKIRLLSQT